jgi:hypothetical protein
VLVGGGGCALLVGLGAATVLVAFSIQFFSFYFTTLLF